MRTPAPITLEGHGVRLEPLAKSHADALIATASDGKLWELWFTSVPEPAHTDKYIEAALDGQRAGHMLPWAVRELSSGAIVGTTRYHDIVPPVERVEIGYTFYARAWQRTHRTPRASCCSWSTRSTRSAVRWWACAPTTSTSHRRRRSPRSARSETECFGITKRDATGQCATA